MASKPESTFITSLHRHFPSKEVPYHMKNHNVYNGGIPDVWYSGRHGDMWVEYKFIEVPKRLTTVIVPNLSELQLQWLSDRQCEGRNVYVIIGCKSGGMVLSGTEQWRNGITTEQFQNALQTRKQLADWITQICVGEAMH